MAGKNGSTRGFAGMDPERQREIASKGGRSRGRNQGNQSGRENNSSSS